jgi:zinc and cadmium transporter
MATWRTFGFRRLCDKRLSGLAWILLSGIAMSAIALVGVFSFLLDPKTLNRVLLPLVALSAGSLIGGAFFHLIPEGFAAIDDSVRVGALVVGGFVVFLVLEILLHWHHSHRAEADVRAPSGYLILIGDGVHNFLGGLAISGMFLVDVRLGAVTWLAAAMHEVPQELGDFAVLVHSGWSRVGALVMNWLTSLTYLLGGLVAYAVAHSIDISWLVPVAAGNFLYIGASDLVPEIKEHTSLGTTFVNVAAFMVGIVLLYLARVLFGA